MGAVETLLSYLNNKELAEFAIWSLENLSASAVAIERLEKSNFVGVLIPFLNPNDMTIGRMLSLLSNIPRFDKNCEGFIGNNGIEAIIRILSEASNDTVLLQALSIMNQLLLCDAARVKVYTILETNKVLEKLEKSPILISGVLAIKTTLGMF